jgi:hypothetical protein
MVPAVGYGNVKTMAVFRVTIWRESEKGWEQLVSGEW